MNIHKMGRTMLSFHTLRVERFSVNPQTFSILTRKEIPDIQAIEIKDMAKHSAEEQLDISLRFLNDRNAGSYVDYKYSEGNDERLFTRLSNEGIEQQLRLPILYHLIYDNYVMDYHKDQNQKDQGLEPKQIKITYKGMLFIQSGGYIEEKKRNARIRRRAVIVDYALIIGAVVAVIGIIYTMRDFIIKIPRVIFEFIR